LVNYLNPYKILLFTLNVTIYKALLQKVKQTMKLRIFKQDNPLKEVFLALGILTGFIFIVTFSSLYVSDAIRNNDACGCVIPIPVMILILSSLGVFVGSISYYFIVSRYAKEKKNINKDIKLTLNFLESNERIMVNELIKNKMGIKQAELEKLTGFHRVKVHRILNKLIRKGVIEKETIGKIKIIKLNPRLGEIF